jgi:hypothetical protein
VSRERKSARGSSFKRGPRPCCIRRCWRTGQRERWTAGPGLVLAHRPASQDTRSTPLGALLDAGLISSRKSGAQRGCHGKVRGSGRRSATLSWRARGGRSTSRLRGRHHRPPETRTAQGRTDAPLPGFRNLLFGQPTRQLRLRLRLRERDLLRGGGCVRAGEALIPSGRPPEGGWRGFTLGGSASESPKVNPRFTLPGRRVGSIETGKTPRRGRVRQDEPLSRGERRATHTR